MGIFALIFGLVYLSVPFYKWVCSQTGLVGDELQQDYSLKAKKGNIHNKFTVEFKGETDEDLEWEFTPVQNQVTVSPGETALVFYRAYNHSNVPKVGIAMYQVFPEDAGIYFAKIQCFCFFQQMLNAKEEVQMPLYFYFEPEIESDLNIGDIKKITVIYKFFNAKKQDVAKLIDEENERVERNLRLIKEMRLKSEIIEDEDQEMSGGVQLNELAKAEAGK